MTEYKKKLGHRLWRRNWQAIIARVAYNACKIDQNYRKDSLLLPEDDNMVESCKTRLWGTPPPNTCYADKPPLYHSEHKKSKANSSDKAFATPKQVINLR